MLVLRRQPDTRPEDEFWYVHDEETGKILGRVFKDLTAKPTDPPSWFWGLSHPYERGSRNLHYGNAGSKEDAMAKFKERWLLTNK